MTRLEAALLDVASFLDERRVPYMVIGGFANLLWGVERFTRDLDIAFEVPTEDLDGLILALQDRFEVTVPDPPAFARRNHLLRMRTRTDVDVDLVWALIPYEIAAIRRAVAVEVHRKHVKVCTAEDLIVHKLASERAQDAVDVEGIVERQAGRLDLDYLWPKVKELAAGLERPEIAERFSTLLRRVDAKEGPNG
jgi:hypothetical protein